MKRLTQWFEDQLLRYLQTRCTHPDRMVAADILEGCADGIAVKYCRRCGAIKTDWDAYMPDNPFITLEHWWRSPDPNLWRG